MGKKVAYWFLFDVHNLFLFNEANLISIDHINIKSSALLPGNKKVHY